MKRNLIKLGKVLLYAIVRFFGLDPAHNTRVVYCMLTEDLTNRNVFVT